ncbi:MAG: phosphoenolpyruvate carboxykinase (GTP) [Candidatus Parcubacteria bacterium]|nr:phosphoenolpyruvate carboxykinase (GTP) [Candidatus Parcubacteria bacterium]
MNVFRRKKAMKLNEIKNETLRSWIWQMAALCQPEQIVIIDGSEEQREELLQLALRNGDLIKLNQDKHPGCYYHRSDSADVARTEHLTFICTPDKDQAGPTNNWMQPQEARDRATEIFQRSMRNRIMYVIPFSMGPVGSEFSKIGVQLTDSLYVVLNMMIMTRVGANVLDALGYKGDFTRCLHGLASLDPERRLILHFPQDNEIWSVGSGYGGNALLGKKCLALRIASYQARQEGWLAEHMLIMGIEGPDGRLFYIAAAFPSACGKTNLAMLIPPEGLKAKGYRVFTIGDDIAWFRVNTDGQLWGINPEAGMFGVAPGTNSQSNPNAMATIVKNTIFTNTLLTPDYGVWWENGEGQTPANGVNWQGLPWYPGLTDADGKKVMGAHPNSRFTAPLIQCPSVSNRIDQPQGVPISAIIFGGRRASVMPLVYEAFNWKHGVYVGATAASEVTAAQTHGIGDLRFDPMAMLPFCGYNMADYFSHWLRVGQRLNPAPKIFHVNWFRKDDDGNFLWPGYGENLRVLEWIIDRCRNAVTAQKTAIGYMPNPADLDLNGLDLAPDALTKLLAIDKDLWLKEMEAREKFLRDKLGTTVPVEIFQQHLELKERLKKMD